MSDSPVMLPPGCARPSTRPLPIGFGETRSLAAAKLRNSEPDPIQGSRPGNDPGGSRAPGGAADAALSHVPLSPTAGNGNAFFWEKWLGARQSKFRPAWWRSSRCIGAQACRKQAHLGLASGDTGDQRGRLYQLQRCGEGTEPTTGADPSWRQTVVCHHGQQTADTLGKDEVLIGDVDRERSISPFALSAALRRLTRP
jgi:hypothetical protein